jgi:hypothetical protein
MFNKLRKFIFGDNRELRRVVDTDFIGQLKFSDDVEAWESVVKIGDKKIKFTIAGDWGDEKTIIEPALPLIEEAQSIASGFDSFSNEVNIFLIQEAEKNSGLSVWKSEIATLEIAEICYLWADRPKDGEIIFSANGSADGRIWGCAITNGSPAPTLSFSS